MGWLKRVMVASLGVALLAAAGPPPVQAQDRTPRVNGIFGTDDRAFVVPSQMPWSAVGRIAFGGPGHCSGALVSPRVVLTAAHCVFAGGGYYDPPARFYAGYHKGSYAAVSGVTSFWVPSGYDYRRHLNAWDVDGFDYAFLLLDRPIGLETGWFGTHRVTVEELDRAVAHRWRPLSQGGYSADTPDQVSVNVDCPITAHFRDFTFAHHCDIMDGDSGSPLFVDDPAGGFGIIGVISTVIQGRRNFGIAVDSRAWSADLARYLARYDPLADYDQALVEAATAFQVTGR